MNKTLHSMNSAQNTHEPDTDFFRRITDQMQRNDQAIADNTDLLDEYFEHSRTYRRSEMRAETDDDGCAPAVACMLAGWTVGLALSTVIIHLIA